MTLRESHRLSVLGVRLHLGTQQVCAGERVWTTQVSVWRGHVRETPVVLHIWLNWDVITSSPGNWTQKRLILAAFFWSSAFFVYGGWMPPPFHIRDKPLLFRGHRAFYLWLFPQYLGQGSAMCFLNGPFAAHLVHPDPKCPGCFPKLFSALSSNIWGDCVFLWRFKAGLKTMCQES